MTIISFVTRRYIIKVIDLGLRSEYFVQDQSYILYSKYIQNLLFYWIIKYIKRNLGSYHYLQILRIGTYILVVEVLPLPTFKF